jgi:hydroxyacyl-ACP dehydratase HTD2-like protein with hotdog domain
MRRFSTEPFPLADLETVLREELTSRPPNQILEYLTNTNSHLLNITLADFIPSSCYPAGFSKSDLQTPRNKDKLGASAHEAGYLPLGHHLVHFPPQVLSSDILPDGTDKLHWPGPPFTRRLWTGGSLSFNRNASFGLHTNNMSAMCKEEITNVWTKGQVGDEKVFVAIRRRIGGFGEYYKPTRWSGIAEPESGSLDGNSDQWRQRSKMGDLALVETRSLVFMRKNSKSHARRDSQLVPSAMKRLMRKEYTLLRSNISLTSVAAYTPDFSISLRPTQNLLFRFSALTFNAHRIHLEKEYCTKVEGHRNLLVHGPLSLVLMLSVLRSQLKEGEMLVQFEYRNLIPLYVEEQMKICIRRDPEKDGRFDVWIEEPGGGYAVKGTALVDKEYVLGTKTLKDTHGRDDSEQNGLDSEGGEQAEGGSLLKVGREFSN